MPKGRERAAAWSKIHRASLFETDARIIAQDRDHVVIALRIPLRTIANNRALFDILEHAAKAAPARPRARQRAAAGTGNRKT